MPTEPSYLREFKCFKDLSDEYLARIAPLTDAVCYLPNQVLMEEGQPGDRILYLLEGDVEVFYALGEAGKVLVDTVSGEEVVGCSALVPPYTYTATERSLTEVVVLEIDAIGLRALMEEDCQLGYLLQKHIIEVLMGRILNLRLAQPV